MVKVGTRDTRGQRSMSATKSSSLHQQQITDKSGGGGDKTTRTAIFISPVSAGAVEEDDEDHDVVVVVDENGVAVEEEDDVHNVCDSEMSAANTSLSVDVHPRPTMSQSGSNRSQSGGNKLQIRLGMTYGSKSAFSEPSSASLQSGMILSPINFAIKPTQLPPDNNLDTNNSSDGNNSSNNGNSE